MSEHSVTLRLEFDGSVLHPGLGNFNFSALVPPTAVLINRLIGASAQQSCPIYLQLLIFHCFG
jgi:hypothetical protein